MHFQIYIPKAVGADSKHLHAVGLGDFCGQEEYVDVAKGPDGDRGLLVSWRPGQPTYPIAFRPDEQTWMPGLIAGYGPPGSYWIGFWNDSPPTPGELAKPDQIDGTSVQLNDGHEWLVPAAYYLPKDIKFQNGTWETSVQKQHLDFWKEAVRYYQYSITRAKSLEEGTDANAGYDSALEDLAHYVAFVFDALELNYRLTIEVVNHLNLFTDKNTLSCLAATLHMLAINQVTAEKKSTEPAETPST